MSDRGGPRAAGRLWSQSERRRRLSQLLVLGVLAGLPGALSIAALCGARRSDSAFERLRSATGAADAVIFASQVGVYAPDWQSVADLPYVEAAGSFGLPFVPFVDGPPGVDLDQNLGLFSVPFGSWRTDVDRPVIVKGRAPDPGNAHEMLAPPEALALGIDVGQEFTLRLPSDEQIEAFDLFTEPQGDRVPMRVVGIGRSTFEVAIIGGGGGGFFTTPAFHREYGSEITFIDNLLVRFRPGQGSIAQLERDARRILDSPQLPVLDAAAVSKRVTNGTELEASGLAVFGLAVALAASALIGQALARSVAAASGDAETLSALGFTRREIATALARPHVIVVVVGATLAFAGAIVLSARFPIGLGRRVDPDVGYHLDWTVFSIALALIVTELAACIVVSAWRATSRPLAGAASRSSRLVQALASWGSPPPVVVGAHLALEPGRGRRALPTRPAIAGAIIGVVGIVGAQTLLAGMDDAVANAERFGASWDIETAPDDFSGVPTFGDAVGDVEAVPGVSSTALIGRGLILINSVTQPTYSITPRIGRLDFTVFRGRRPSGGDEIALGPETAETFGVGIGDSVVATASDGTTDELRVVGLAFLPTTPHSSYDQGAWVAPEELERLAGSPIGQVPPGADPSSTWPPIEPRHVAQFDEAVDLDGVVTALNAGYAEGQHVSERTAEPLDAENLRNVTALPLLFALFTLVLAMGTLVHLCASVVRRRGTDLAVLRALGITPRGTRSAIAWQARTLCIIALLVGVPVGVVIGRLIWRIIATNTPLVFAPPTAWLGLVLAAPVAFVAAAGIALVPGRRASRIKLAELLRQE